MSHEDGTNSPSSADSSSDSCTTGGSSETMNALVTPERLINNDFVTSMENWSRWNLLALTLPRSTYDVENLDVIRAFVGAAGLMLAFLQLRLLFAAFYNELGCNNRCSPPNTKLKSDITII
jgi:hypothetical protein